MSLELKLPEIGENISQGTVTKILVKAGEAIKKGQNILELETDKAVVEIPSHMEGIVSEILIKAGTVVKVGQPVFILGTAQQESRPAPASSAPVPPAAVQEAQQPGQKPSTAATSGPVTEMKLPALGENLEKGTITKILVKPGDLIKKGQGILELETDKAVIEVPSALDALIKEVLVKNGSVVKVGENIFKIESGISPSSASPQSSSASQKTSPKPAVSSADVKPAFLSSTITTPPIHFMAGDLPVRKNVSAAPSVRIFAREIGIDLAMVTGSGPGGRISIDDVKKFAKALNTGRIQAPNAAAATPDLPDFSKWGSSKREAMSNVRRKTAEHLSMAWSTIPHVTQCEKVDISQIEQMRKANSNAQRKLSVTSYLIKIICLALKQFPQFNASVDMNSKEIIFKEFINIGVAVDTDRGLLVPVLKNVDLLSVGEISDQLTALAEKARNRKTSMDDLQGGTFTISNLGGIGGSFFSPIVNWPEVAILGVSRAVMEPIYIEGTFLPRLMLPLSLSYDHRLIDGADGARFIRWVANALEKPSSLEGELRV